MIIYQAQNQINGKIYIGQTINKLSKRISQHLYKATTNTTIYFYNAIRKYGKKNFIWSVLEKCNNINELNEREKYYIDKLDTLNKGYNLITGGNNKIYSNKSKVKMSKSANKRWENLDERKKMSEMKSGKNNPWYGTKGYWYGKKMECTTGDLNSSKRPKVRAKISKSMSGENNPWYNKKRPNHSKKMIGGGNPQAINIIVNGIKFETITQASKKLNISQPTIRKRLNSNKYKNYMKL